MSSELMDVAKELRADGRNRDGGGIAGGKRAQS